MFVRYLLFVSFFLFLIPMSVLGISTYWISLFILSLLSFYLGVKLTTSSIYVLSSFLFLFVFDGVNVLLHQHFELYILKVTLIGVVLFLNAYLLVSCYQIIYGVKAERFILKGIIIIASVNSAFALLFILFGELRSFFYTFLDTNPINAHHLNLGVRSSGLFYFGASILSIFNFIVLYITAVYLSVYQLSIKNKLLVVLSFLLSVVGILLSGRLGLMMTIIGFFCVLFLPRGIHLIKKQYAVSFLFCAIVFISVISCMYFDLIHVVFDRSFELFVNYIDGNGFTSESTDVLGGMYFLPNNIIFGDGSFGRDADVKYIDSDAGYILMIFYAGFCGVFVYLFHFLYLFLFGLKNKKNLERYGDKLSFKFLCLCLICVFIGNFKDVYFYGSQGVSQLLMISIALFCRFNNIKVAKNL